MTKVLEHKTENVTVGILDKTLQLMADWHSVTFADVFGGIHTVFAHKDGPFKTPADVIAAFEDGVLHTFKTHEAAASYEADRGNHDVAERLSALSSIQSHRDEPQQGSDY